jgi:hypothetical protein
MKLSFRPRDTRRAFFAFLLLAVCASPGYIVAADSTDANSLLGSWVLETVDGEPPADLAIKSWQINFSADHKWTYGGELTEKFPGMQLRGAGEWKINAAMLEYSAGGDKGQSRVSFRDKLLILTPDPVVVIPKSKTRVVTIYKRIGAQ